MGVADASLRALQRSKGFTLSVQTALVEALVRLDDVSGRPEVVVLAATAETSDQALFARRATLGTIASAPLASVAAKGTLVGRERGDASSCPVPSTGSREPSGSPASRRARTWSRRSARSS